MKPEHDLSTIKAEAPTEFATKAEYYDWLFKEFADTLTILSKAQEVKYAIRDILDAEVGNEDKKSGTLKLVGAKYKANIVRSVRGSYVKHEGDVAPFLQTIYEQIPELRKAIKISFEEKTATMTKELSALAQHYTLHGTDEQKKLLADAMERRQLTKGATQITVDVI